MKPVAFVIFTFLISSLAGAEVVKIRLNSDAYRIVLSGQDAQRLVASVGNRSFSSTGTLDSLSCINPIGRCELSFHNANLQSFESIQEQLRLADDSGLTVPQIALPRNVSEQLLTANIDDPVVAEKLYNLLPGPEVDFNFDHALAEGFSGKTKTLDLARNEFFMACQKIEHTSSAGKKGYSCLVNAIVPSGKN